MKKSTKKKTYAGVLDEQNIDTVLKQARRNEFPINLKVYSCGTLIHTFDTDNLLETFINIPIDVNNLKGMTRMDCTYNGKMFSQNLNIPRMRRMIVNDVLRQIITKQFVMALGIPNQNV